MRRGAKKARVQLNSEELVNRFLAEVLSLIGSYERYSEAEQALKNYFASLEPYRQWGDFAMEHMLPRPEPLEIFVEPFALYGRFRAWLRKTGDRSGRGHRSRCVVKRNTAMVRDTSDYFIEDENPSDELEALQEAIAEAEDISAEFAIERHKDAHHAARGAERVSKEKGQ